MTKDVIPDGGQGDLIGEIRDGTGRPVLRVTLSLKVERL